MRDANVRERKWRDVNSELRAIGGRSTLLRCSVRSHKLSGSAAPRLHCSLVSNQHAWHLAAFRWLCGFGKQALRAEWEREW